MRSVWLVGGLGCGIASMQVHLFGVFANFVLATINIIDVTIVAQANARCIISFMEHGNFSNYVRSTSCT